MASIFLIPFHPRHSPEDLRGGISCPGSHICWWSWDMNPGLSDSKTASLAACHGEFQVQVPGDGKMIRSEFHKFDIESSNPRAPQAF